MYVLLAFISKVFLVSTEVITFIRDDNITCAITEDSIFDGLYFTSPKHVIRRKIKDLSNEFNDEWNTTTSDDVSFFPVTDIRWENFTIVKSPITLNLTNRKTPFSVCFLKQTCSQEMLKLRTSNNRGEPCHWIHYFLENGQLYSYKNLTKVKCTLNEISEKDVLVKEHKYKFKIARHIHFQTPTPINLSLTSENSCVSFFASLDQNSSLNVTLKQNDQILSSEIFDGFNVNQTRLWKRFEIKFEPAEQSAVLTIQRIKKDSGTTGFWALDKLSLCSSKMQFYSEQVEPETVFSCKSLNSEATQPFCRKFAYFGQKCSISLENIFGDFHQENYKVCLENDECECMNYKSRCSDDGRCDGGFERKNCTLWCGKYDNNGKCIKCSYSRYFGEKCDQKLPVSIQAPILADIQNDQLEFNLKELKYGFDEAKPTSYQLQYKADSDLQFFNISGIQPFTSISENVKFRPPLSASYKIRILLYVGIQHFEEDIPELLVYKHSLNATVKDNNIYFYWDNGKLENITRDVYLDFTCQGPNGTTFCQFRLFTKILESYSLLDVLNINYTKQDLISSDGNNFDKSKLNKTCISNSCLKMSQSANLILFKNSGREIKRTLYFRSCSSKETSLCILMTSGSHSEKRTVITLIVGFCIFIMQK